MISRPSGYSGLLRVIFQATMPICKSTNKQINTGFLQADFFSSGSLKVFQIVPGQLSCKGMHLHAKEPSSLWETRTNILAYTSLDCVENSWFTMYFSYLNSFFGPAQRRWKNQSLNVLRRPVEEGRGTGNQIHNSLSYYTIYEDTSSIFLEILSKELSTYERRAGRESPLMDCTAFVILGPFAVL